MLNWLKGLWCDLTHGGGWVMRDPSGCVNWQCRKCGRWATPVPKDDEKRTTDSAIRARIANPADGNQQ